MHSATIILTKAEDNHEAKDNVQDFLEDYHLKAYDWYAIGGRWSGALNKEHSDFLGKAEIMLDKEAKEGCLAMSVGNIEKNEGILQEIWEEGFGKDSPNPLNRNQYQNYGYPDDAMPAKECREILEEWADDPEKEAQRSWEKILQKKKEEEQGEKASFPEIYMRDYVNWRNDELFFDSSVYNMEKLTHDIPQDLSGYYAVVIDKHI